MEITDHTFFFSINLLQQTNSMLSLGQSIRTTRLVIWLICSLLLLRDWIFNWIYVLGKTHVECAHVVMDIIEWNKKNSIGAEGEAIRGVVRRVHWKDFLQAPYVVMSCKVSRSFICVYTSAIVTQWYHSVRRCGQRTKNQHHRPARWVDRRAITSRVGFMYMFVCLFGSWLA